MICHFISSALELIKLSIEKIKVGTVAGARDNCLKSIGLIEAIDSDSFNFHSQLATSKLVLERICQKLLDHSLTTTISVKLKEPTDSTQEIVCRSSNISFASIIGHDNAKQALYENVILPLTIDKQRKLELFKGIRANIGNVLLHGPPGTGKTMLAQAVAYESNASLIVVYPSDILSKYQGESENLLRNVFQCARGMKRSVIFFDEFDSVAISRGRSDDGAQARRLLSELLLQLTYQKQLTQTAINADIKQIKAIEHHDNWDGDGKTKPLKITKKELSIEKLTTSDGSGLVVIAATNRYIDLDVAVIRRFEAKIYVGTLDILSRIMLIRKCLSEIDHSLNDKELNSLAKDTETWSGCEIELLCRNAAMVAVRDFIPYSSTESFANTARSLSSLHVRPVSIADFDYARSTMTTEYEDDHSNED
eukprot:gene9058-12218_t